MVYNNSVELRFIETMNREGIYIKNITKNKEIQAFFRRLNKGITSREFKKAFCKLEDVNIGDVLQVGKEYYIVLNQNNENSNIYSSLTLERCSESWHIFGQEIHVVCQNGLLSPSEDIINVFGQISGTLTCIVTDTPIIHNICTINNIFVTFKGCYEIKNTFYDKGLAYIYLEKCPIDTSEYTIATEDIKFLNIGNSINLNAMVEHDKTKCVNATYTYHVDNDDILSVDNTGLITALKLGRATITLTAIYSLENSNGDTNYRTLTKTIDMSVLDALNGGHETPVEPIQKEYVVFKHPFGDVITNEWTIDTHGFDISAYLCDENGNENREAIPKWEYALYDKTGNQVQNMSKYCRIKNIEGNDMEIYTVYPSHYGLYDLVLTATFENGISGTLKLELNE